MAKVINPLIPSLKAVLAATTLVGLLSVTIQQPASAQGLKHFYMARQQVQITDDSPMVNDQRTFPTAGQPGQAGVGAMPNRPMALPKAGFQQYSPTMPSFNTSLPQVVNGVPPKEPPPQQVKQGKKAKAGTLKPTEKKATAKSTAPPVTAAKAYSPYKGYNPGAAPAEPQTTTAQGTTNMQAKTRVKGVLHWARGH